MKQKNDQVPIRVGVNSGSLEKELVEKYHGVTAEGTGGECYWIKCVSIEKMGYDQSGDQYQIFGCYDVCQST